jgi:hypothetical protein
MTQPVLSSANSINPNDDGSSLLTEMSPQSGLDSESPAHHDDEDDSSITVVAHSHPPQHEANGQGQCPAELQLDYQVESNSKARTTSDLVDSSKQIQSSENTASSSPPPFWHPLNDPWLLPVYLFAVHKSGSVRLTIRIAWSVFFGAFGVVMLALFKDMFYAVSFFFLDEFSSDGDDTWTRIAVVFLKLPTNRNLLLDLIFLSTGVDFRRPLVSHHRSVSRSSQPDSHSASRRVRRYRRQ